MQASHYNPFFYITKQEYEKQLNTLKGMLGDSIPVKQFALLLHKITSLLNDAHSTLQLSQPVFGEEYKKTQFFPYKLIHHGNKLYAPVGTDIPAGSEIVAINGQKIPELYSDIQKIIPGVAAFKAEAACRLFSYFVFLHDIKPPFTVEYRAPENKPGKITINEGVTYRAALSANFPHIAKPFDFKIIDTKLACLDIRTLSAGISQLKAFLDTSFAAIKAQDIHTLAIDLRQNSGGNTELGELLFSYITRRPFSFGAKHWKISQAYKDVLIANGDTAEVYLQKPNGSTWQDAAVCKPRENKFKSDVVFDGKVYFITGPFTFSSAMAVADVVKTYNLGTLIGEAPGERAMDFGEAFSIQLPHSKFRIQSTTSFSLGARCGETKNRLVEPDILLQATLPEKVEQNDPVMKYLLKNTIK
ncbi:hypothetical protein CTE07_24610 [Chitinophaga terrae (ex Kim and Jung 2007)]|nr:hypothetical protein CTE07_24610 [Chitinophaga terrae (ex Kim and Jung 2007)]